MLEPVVTIVLTIGAKVVEEQPVQEGVLAVPNELGPHPVHDVEPVAPIIAAAGVQVLEAQIEAVQEKVVAQFVPVHDAMV